MRTKKRSFTSHSRANVFTQLAFACSYLWVASAYPANLIVTSTANNGPGSLRTSIANAATGAIPGDTITFDSSLSGATIYLASALTVSKQLTIDGSALASKITISGDTDGGGSGDVSVFTISGASSIALNSLIITKGSSVAAPGG